MPKPGDFGLVAIAGAPGLLIRIGQWLNGNGWADYQHALVYLGDGNLTSEGVIIEAEPGGARVRLMAEYADSNIVWSNWDLTDQQRGQIVAAARGYFRVPYSWLDYFALAAHRLHLPVPGLRRYIASTGHVICSQLVDLAYQAAGVHLFNDGRWPGYVTPLALRQALDGPA